LGGLIEGKKKGENRKRTKTRVIKKESTGKEPITFLGGNQ